ncbi:hypothetical protein IMZ31_23720 (plasmid) [Pontibacillus sp. ALD_SL1]|uniref:hypothetical protein n=1 Tax=Pontibacillus sp. ALD_SL1 TaxID=2777185 RepID=UPI001A974AD6|nr:hypothetical protein [Pontibacillus sp. ALD_SL1]QST02461.1 hypothetical protein IMZ31_23720 [Pontibacillus sp. ALD_SL1]
MNKREQLAKYLRDYPEHEIIMMYSNEASDHPYTIGDITKILVEQIYSDESGRVWLRNWDGEELAENMRDESADEKEILNKMNKLPWKKAILVYVDPALSYEQEEKR